MFGVKSDTSKRVQECRVPLVRLLVGIAVAVGLGWVLFVTAIMIFRPKGINFADAKRLVPDIVRLLKALVADPDLPSAVRRRLALLLAYLALPFDLVPDFIPVLGYADDLIVVAMVLRAVVRSAGSSALQRHWTGTSHGLAVVKSLSGLGRQ